MKQLPSSAHEISLQLSVRAQAVAAYLLPNGKPVNGCWRCGDAHGEPGQSLSLELQGDKAGKWFDHATGERGDLLDLFAIKHKADIKTAMKEASQWLGQSSPATQSPPKTIISGKASMEKVYTWTYPTKDGITGRTVRSDNTDGTKNVIPYFHDDPSKAGIKPGYVPPLYGKTDPRYVFVAEGEKCVDALLQMGLAAVTSQGGCNAAGRADWSALDDCKTVYLLPDNDAAGDKYAAAVTAMLKARDPQREVLRVELDALPDAGDVVDWAMARIPDWDGYREDGRLQGLKAELRELAKDARPNPLMERMDDAPMVGALLQNPTEDNVALAFSEQWKGEYIYMHGLRCWFRWDGMRWQQDRNESVNEAMRRLARAYNVSGKYSIARNNFYQSCLKIAQSDPDFARHVEEFDADNYLLNTPDGTYDLRTGLRRPHSPADCITMMTAVSPSAHGGERFLQFLHEVFGGDGELIGWVQTALGACLSGAVEEHYLLFWTGSGRNGKNTLGDLVMLVLGDYAKAISSDVLMSKKNAEHKTEIANLKGCRLTVASETEEGDFWAESKVKSLTGDTMLSARLMRSDYFEFRRTHKHLIYGNHRPQLRSLDKAMRSRLKVVPFNVSFIGREDAELPAKLWKEASFVLHWLMEGHERWIQQGRKVGSCAAIDAETKDYFSMQATIENWLDERCLLLPDDARAAYQWIKAKDFYQDYKQWCQDGGVGVPSLTRFGEKMNSLGVKKIKSNGARYVGILLNP